MEFVGVTPTAVANTAYPVQTQPHAGGCGCPTCCSQSQAAGYGNQPGYPTPSMTGPVNQPVANLPGQPYAASTRFTSDKFHSSNDPQFGCCLAGGLECVAVPCCGIPLLAGIGVGIAKLVGKIKEKFKKD